MPSAQLLRGSSTTALKLFPELHPDKILPRLRADRYPSAPEANVLRRLLAEAQAQLDSYDEDVFEPQELRDTLKMQISTTKSLLSPIRRLPTEILGEIIFCDRATNRIGEETSIPAAQLRTVCMSWWNAIHMTPTLWSDINVHYDYPSLDHEFSDSVLLQLETLILYSRTTPITIKMTDSMGPLGFLQYSVSAQRIAHILTQHAARIQTLSIPFIIAVSMESPSEAWGSLESLEVIGTAESQGHVVPAFQDTPKLHIVSLSGLLSTQFLFPWSQITHLNLNWLPSELMVETAALSNCPSLQTLHCSTIVTPSGWVALPSTTSLETLIITEVNDIETAELAPFFEALTFPRLSTVIIMSSEDGFHTVLTCPNILPSLLASSSGTITTLHLERISVAETALKELLRVLSSLTVVIMREPDRFTIEEPDTSLHPSLITDGILRLLQRNSSISNVPSQSILPHLQTLDFRIRGRHFTDQLFLDMVNSRVRRSESHALDGLACLKSVVFEVMDRKISSSIVEALYALKDGGLDIRVRGGSQCGKGFY